MDVKDAVDLYRAVLITYSEEFDLRDVLGRIAHILGGRKPLLFLRDTEGFRIRLWAEWELAEVSRLAASAFLDEKHPDFPRAFRMADAALAESLGLQGLVNGTGDRLMLMPVPLHGEPRALLAMLIPGNVSTPQPHSFRLTAVASVIDKAVDLLEQRRRPEPVLPEAEGARMAGDSAGPNPDLELMEMKREVASLEELLLEHKDHRKVAAFSLDILIRLLDLDGGTVYLLPPAEAGPAPQLLAARGWTGLPGLLEVLFESGLVGWLRDSQAAGSEHVLLDVTGLSENFRSVEPYLYANNVNAFMLSPLFHGDELQGVLALFGRAYTVFEPEDLEILERLSVRLAGLFAGKSESTGAADPESEKAGDEEPADQAVPRAEEVAQPAEAEVAVTPAERENAGELEARLENYRRALAHLAELSAELSLVSKPEAVKRLIAHKALEITGAGRATLLLCSGDSIESFTEGAPDLPGRLDPFRLAPVLSRALEERRAIRSEAPPGPPIGAGLAGGQGESLVVPIMAAGEVLGAILLEMPESGAFGADGMALAEAAAGCCAAALQLLGRRDPSVGGMTLPLSERISGLLRGSMTFEEICEIVHVELKADLDADLSAVYVDGPSGTRANALLRGAPLDPELLAPLYEANAAELEGEAFQAEPVLRHLSARSAQPEEAFLLTHGIRSYLLLPVSTNETRGFWVVGAATSYAFERNERDVLQRVAGMLSAILEAALCRETIENAHNRLLSEFDSLEEQNQFKTDLLNMASHEVRHPLTLLMGFSEVLNDYYPSLDSSEMLRVVRKISKSAERLKRRVANLLELSRIESGRMELERTDLEVEPLVREIAEELELENPGHHIYLSFPMDFPRIRADREKLEIVLFNLMENSIKYSPSGGNIQVRGRADANGVAVSIIDDGIGIEAEDLVAIFKPFRRGVEKVKTVGMGLGLYIVDTIVRAHGGTIEVESQPGRGSSFTVRFAAEQT